MTEKTKFYHHIPKTGGTSIITYYIKNETVITELPNQIFKTNDYILYHNHLSSLDLYDIVLIRNSDHIISVRDPINRFISLCNFDRANTIKYSTSSIFSKYDFVKKEFDDFISFMRKNFWYAQSIQEKFIKDFYQLKQEYGLHVNFLRNETLNEDAQKILGIDLDSKKINVTKIKLDKINLNEWKWEDLSNENKRKLIQIFYGEYKFLDFMGVHYDIPTI